MVQDCFRGVKRWGGTGILRWESLARVVEGMAVGPAEEGGSIAVVVVDDGGKCRRLSPSVVMGVSWEGGGGCVWGSCDAIDGAGSVVEISMSMLLDSIDCRDSGVSSDGEGTGLSGAVGAGMMARVLLRVATRAETMVCDTMHPVRVEVVEFECK